MGQTVVAFPARKRRMRLGSINNVVVPQLHRLTGYRAKLVDGRIEADHDCPETDYVLDPDETQGLVGTKTTPIHHLAPAIDPNLWVVIRKHRDLPSAKGYIGALRDLDPNPLNDCRLLYLTGGGVYTLVKRRKAANCPDHLVVYVAPNDNPDELDDTAIRVVGPDGADLPPSVLDQWMNDPS